MAHSSNTSDAAPPHSGAVHPEAASFVRALVRAALNTTPEAATFCDCLLQQCSVRFEDILDHIAIPPGVGMPAAGWRQVEAGVWRHHGGCLPDILEREHMCIAFRAEHVEAFLSRWGIETPIEGAPHGCYRRARVFAGPQAAFDAVERHGWMGFDAPSASERTRRRARIHQQTFRTRQRQFRSAALGLRHTRRLVEAAAADLGPHWACDLFLRAEREHWMRDCAAGALQKRRQDRAGIGWCNVDHHSFVCSREHFHGALAILELLGYERGPQLRAKPRGGRSAQVLRQPALRADVLVEVDLAVHDASDAALQERLSPLTFLGPAGLWAAVHGESLLDAGLGSLGARVDCAALREAMLREGVDLLDPAQAAPPLRRERTRAEWRAVDPKRVNALEKAGHLRRSDADQMRLSGAFAAHFEGIERADGFSGIEIG